MFSTLYILWAHLGASMGFLRASDKLLQYCAFATLLVLPFIIKRVSERGFSPRVRALLLLLSVLAAGYFAGLATIAVAGVLVGLVAKLRRLKWRAFSVGAVLLLAIVFWAKFHTLAPAPTVDLYEDGPRLSAVNEVLFGSQPYRDIMIHYGVLNDVVRPLLAFRLWNETYEADLKLGRALSAGCAVLLALTCFVVTRNSLLAIILGLLIAWRMDLFMSERTFLLGAYAFAYCMGLRQRKKVRAAWLTLAGFLLGANLLYSLEIGLTACIAFLAYAIADLTYGVRWRVWNDLRCVLCGFMASALLFLGYLTAIGALSKFVENLIAMTFRRLPTWADGLRSHYFMIPRSFSFQAYSSYLYLHGVPLLCCAVWTWLVVQPKKGRKSVQWHQAAFLSFVVFTSFFIYIGRSDYAHWRRSTYLLWPLLVLIIQACLRKCSQWSWRAQARWSGVPIAICLITAIIYLRGPVGWGTYIWFGMSVFEPRSATAPDTEQITMPTRLGAVHASQEKMDEIRRVVDSLQKRIPMDGYFFDFSNYGGYYFLAKRRNATRYGLVNYVHGTAMINDCIEHLEAKRPPAVLVELNAAGGFVYRPDLKPLANYLESKYRLADSIQHLAVLTRRD